MARVARGRSRTTLRRRTALAVAAVAWALVPAPASATVLQSPLITDGPDHPVGVFGRVNAIAVAGNTAYIGGDFTSVGGNTRNNLAAIDLTSGRVTGWNPDADGVVNALAVSVDGSLVYAGGEFNQIGGVYRRKLAAINVSNGAPTAWHPIPSARVNAIDVDADTVYIGGAFETVGPVETPYLAAVDATTGAADASWAPYPDAGVKALDLAPNGTTVFFGGSFTQVGTSARLNAAAVNAANGNVTSWNPDAPHVVLDLEVSDDSARVYLAMGGLGPQGGNIARAFNATSGATLWSRQADGDVQALAVADDEVYVGGHFGEIGGASQNKMAAFDPITGSRNTNWNPGANSEFGIWAMTESNDRLLVGGDFSTIGGVSQRHFAMFVHSGGWVPAAHVHDLDPQPVDLTPQKWRAVVAVAVRDANGDPVVGALVEGYYGQGKDRSCVTASNGKCKVKVKVKDAKNRIPWTMTNVTALGGYDPEANHDAVGGDSDGHTILVWQP